MSRGWSSPYVAGAFNFLLYDERDLSRWQTGLVRPDGSPKPAFGAFAQAASAPAASTKPMASESSSTKSSKSHKSTSTKTHAKKSSKKASAPAA